jgi:hypothetical protein
MKSTSKNENQVVKFNSLTHNDIKKLFVHIVNIVRPSHPYIKDPYPISLSGVKYSYKKASSSYYASCGPRNDRDKPVLFKSDKSYFNDSEPEKVLSIIAHELTHITVGNHSNIENGGHPPRFWRNLGFNAHLILDDWDNVETLFGSISKEKFIGYIISNEVTKFNIDKRYGSEILRKHEMANWFKNTLSN